MNVGIEKLETGYIVSAVVPQPEARSKQQPQYLGLIMMYSDDPAPPKVTRYACKTLYEVAGLLEQLFIDSAFVAKDVAMCGEVVKRKRVAKEVGK